MKVAVMLDRTHNPFDEIYRVSCLRENLTSSSKGEGLETGLRNTLNGHVEGNPGDSQGYSYGLPRQSFTRQCLFAVMKRRGFNLEDTHLTDPERVSRLVAVLTLALCWCYKVGVWLDQKKPIALKKHQRRVCSVVRLGLDTLRHLLLNAASKKTQLRQMIGLLFEKTTLKANSYG